MKSTKFWLSVAIFVTATLFRIYGFIDQETWMQTVTVVIGAYGLSNAAATWAHASGRSQSSSDLSRTRPNTGSSGEG